MEVYTNVIILIYLIYINIIYIFVIYFMLFIFFLFQVHAADLMWRRSVEKNGLRYTIMLSDGDSKAHTAVSKIYDVQKEECINHVHKRLGYHLRKISNIAAKDKVTTGGNGYGQLTGKVIDKLSSYYRNSVSNIISIRITYNYSKLYILLINIIFNYF